MGILQSRFVRFRPNLISNAAGIAQLVEHNLAKVGVASSNLVSRSKPALAMALRQDNHINMQIYSWADRYKPLFHALSLQKTMLYCIFGLIILIAIFNMLSSMVLLVGDKRGSIAILRSQGMYRASIIRIFMMVGILVGMIGIMIGNVLGLLISYHINTIIQGVEWAFHTKLIDKGVYLLDYMPVYMDHHDILCINLITAVICVVIAIYPSFKAASIAPAKVLKGNS